MTEKKQKRAPRSYTDEFKQQILCISNVQSPTDTQKYLLL